MADKPYVGVESGSVVKVFDNKYKSTLPNVMKAATLKALKASGKVVCDKPSDKDATGFTLDVGLVSLDKKDQGNSTTVEAKIKISISEWPKPHMVAFPSGGAKATGGLKEVDGLVKDAVEGAIEALVKSQVIKFVTS